MDTMKESDKIFAKVAESVEWTETQSIEQATELLKKLRNDTNGLVIVDFLDSECYDCIGGVESDNGFLKILWKDFGTANGEGKKCSEGLSLNSTLIKFKELRIEKTQRFPVFILRGYALKDKEIKKYLEKDSTEFKIYDFQDNFSKMVMRKINGLYETYRCLNTPIFSMIIIPKNGNISSSSSKKRLFYYNLSDSIVRLNKVKGELENEELVDADLICEKANSIRRILEYLLKVELCYRSSKLNVKKDYSMLMLGELTSLIKPFINETINDLLRQIVVLSNELSHESGKPIKRETVLALSQMTIFYADRLQSIINRNPYYEE